MADADFVFSYHPENGERTLDAYDAYVALYGIARSISILTHYVINNRIIKQAPSLKGARVLLQPPRAGSFEFIINVLDEASNPNTFGGIVVAGAMGQLAANALYDLTKTVFSRLTGKPEVPKSEFVQQLARGKPGELDALSDTVEEDIVRIQRPLIHNVTNINISGGTANIIGLNHDTYDFALTKIVSDNVEEFIGHVTFFNGATTSGRFWLDEEERTVGFSIERNVGSLPNTEKRLLSGSLDDWVNRLEGQIVLRGYTLRSKQGLLKRIFVTKVLAE
jgi:hypothetical protein